MHWVKFSITGYSHITIGFLAPDGGEDVEEGTAVVVPLEGQQPTCHGCCFVFVPPLKLTQPPGTHLSEIGRAHV